jgi:hypothetical protein
LNRRRILKKLKNDTITTISLGNIRKQWEEFGKMKIQFIKVQTVTVIATGNVTSVGFSIRTTVLVRL